MSERLTAGTWVELEKNQKFRSASEIKSLGSGAKAGK